jgi:multidrug efflux system membrane fusion protein
MLSLDLMPYMISFAVNIRGMVSSMKAFRYICLVLGGVSLVGCTSKGSTPPGGKKGAAGGEVPVSVTKVTRKNVPVEIQVIGNVEAYSTIAVKAQVGGILTKVDFKEGDYVKNGDLLFTIDPRPLKAQLAQAVATLSKDEALLRQAEANLARDLAQEKYAAAQAGRYAKLAQEGVISAEQSDQMRTNADAIGQAVSADRAAIESAKAEITAMQATIENDRVMLGYTEIRSPIDGRTGNLNIKLGNVVTANSMEMMTIHEVSPIYVTFSVPEAQLRLIKKYMAVGKLPVFATPQDDEADKESGVLTFVDNAVDPSTGTIKLKGTFQNADRKLWPGEFVRVVLRLTTQSNALVVPNQAVQTGQQGEFVFVVKNDRTVESRPVTTGIRVDQELVVDQGLAFGETVVTDGQLRLSPGARVSMRDNRAKPATGGLPAT